MPNRSSAPVLIVGLVIAVGAMALLNNAQYQNRPKTMQELQAEDEAQSKAHEQEHDRKPPGAKTAVATAADKLVELGPDTTLGPESAKKQVTIGYNWTPEVQADPMRVYGPIEMSLKMSRGELKVRVVNLDAPGAPAVPPGLSVDGKVVARLRPAGGFDPGEMQRAFGEAMKSGAIPNAGSAPAK